MSHWTRPGNLYVIHEGHEQKKDHPSIFVFDPDGKYIRSFGNEYQGGGHGLEVRNEDGTEFLYVTGYQQVKMIGKYDLLGEKVWTKFAPMGSDRLRRRRRHAPAAKMGPGPIHAH